MEETEVWKKIKGFSRYEISNLGRIRNEKKILKQRKCLNGYPIIGLVNDFGKTINRRVHSLLYYTYYDKIEKNNYSIDHINRIRDDNRLENLREISIKEQIKNRVISNKNKFCRKIYRICSNTNKILAEYNSIKEAKIWLRENTKYSVGNCLSEVAKKNGKMYNFIWKYKENEIIENEEWKLINIDDFKELWNIINIDKIKKYNGYYISTKGRLKRPSEKILNGTINGGYLHYATIRSHILVACVFIKNDDIKNKIYVNHIDHNKLNNSINNLEWVSQSENCLAYKKFKRNEENIQNIIQYDLSNNIIKVFDDNYSIPMIAKELNISPITIKAHLDNKVLKPKKFIFRWSNNNINKNRPNIIQYDLNNNIIKIFDNNYSSIKMISEEINISEATIRLHLQNKIKTKPKKFIFKYEEQIT